MIRLRPSRARARRAFSLIELLVVIAIITILLALLLTVVARARKQANQVVCLSNLRQVALAMLAYAEAHRGSFPAGAYNVTMYDEDWVHWQPTIPGHPRDLRGGGIMPYLGGDTEILKCPMGVPERGPTRAGPFTFPPYPFSYSVSERFTGYSVGLRFDPRISGQPYARLGKIINPSAKAMMIEEDITGIDDGMWNPDGHNHLTSRYCSLSLRHDKPVEFEGPGPEPGPSYFLLPAGGRGNVAFADGHCEFYPRWNLQYEKYTDPNYRDP